MFPIVCVVLSLLSSLLFGGSSYLLGCVCVFVLLRHLLDVGRDVCTNKALQNRVSWRTPRAKEKEG